MNRIFFSCLICGFLLLPYSLNLLLNSKSLAIWFLTSQICLLIVLFLSGHKVSLIKMPSGFYLAFLSIFGFGLLSGITYLEGVFYALVFLLVVCLIYLNVSILVRMENKIFERTFKLFFFILLSLGFITLCMRIFFADLFTIFNLDIKNILLIGEPSIYALMLGPVSLWYGIRFNKNIFTLTVIFIFGAVFPSAILLSYGMIYIMVLMFFSPVATFKKVLFLVSAVLSIQLLLSFQMNYFLPRFSTITEEMNLSSLMYFVHWDQFRDVILKVQILGDGFGQSENISQSSSYIYRVLELYGYDITSGSGDGVNAGHFYMSRLAVSIGYGVIIFILLYSASLFKSYKAHVRRNTQVLSVSFLIILGFLPEMILRTPGIFGFGLFWFVLGLCYLQQEAFNDIKIKRTDG